MTDKVTNIYIDTTGFCADAIDRVAKAFKVIVDHNGVDEVSPLMTRAVIGFDEDGEWRYYYHEFPLVDERHVGLWELESIASRCKSKKKESPLNIYIDARELDQEQRRNAFAAITKLRTNESNGWAPDRLASSGCDADYILFDIFALGENGARYFYSGHRIAEMNADLGEPKELTYDQLMSLTS